MAYTTPQIDTILLKADKVMYKIGQKAYDSMFAEDNEALDYERDIIFIYKKAVEYGENVLIGTDKFDKVVERLATKIAGYDYGELNPIYSDVNSLSIPILFPGSALNDLTDVTIANLLDNQLLRYNAATGQWVNVGPGAAVRNSQAFIATAGQTVFTTSIPFDAGLFDLYVNGVKLNSLSFTTMGEYQITLNDPCSAGDIVDVVVYDPNIGINPSANTLNDLTDVSIGPLANKQGLYYNSATGLWENGLVFVPYTGATAAVDLGEFEIRAGQFTLDTSPTGTATVGTTRWNDSIGSSETTLKGGSVILKNGVDLVARVVNKVTPNTTLTKASYAAVRISGAQGQRLAVAYAQANNDANSADTIGLVTETIPTNQEGFIMTMGSLEGINTTGSLQGETWADGDVLYLSPTVPGRITNVKPTGATGHIVVVGYVEYAHANNGKIFVKTMNGWELDELHNVSINYATLANGNVLKYNSTTQLWENGIDAGGITGSGAAGQVPYFTGATSLGGSDNLFWDNANGRLGIGTNAPAYPLHLVGARFTQTGSTSSAATTLYSLQDTSNISNTSYILFGVDINGGTVGFGSQAGAYMSVGKNGTGTARPLILHNYDAQPIIFATNNSERARIFGNGNFAINSSIDFGVRFAVSGDTILRGSGNTSATTALTVQNSSNQNILRVLNNGDLRIGNASNYVLAFPYSTVYDTSDINGTNISIYPTNGSISLGGGTQSPTSSNANNVITKGRFQPTSGTATFADIRCEPLINQTGGANGITRGLYVNPTLTSAADFRAIETTAGNVLFGSNFFWDNANSRLGILNSSPAYELHVGSTTKTTPTLINAIADNTRRAGFIVEGGGDTRFFAGYVGATVYGGISQGVLISSPGGYNISFGVVNTPIARFYAATGNLVIQNGGTFSDSGQRLQVIGDTRLGGNLTLINTGTTTFTYSGAGSFSHDAVGTGGQLVYNPASGIRYKFAGGTSGFIFGATSNTQTTGTTILISSSNLPNNNVFQSSITPNFTGGGDFATIVLSGTVSLDALNNLSGGIQTGIKVAETFSPNTANKDIRYIGVSIQPSINQTAGLTQITRGLYINPSITAAADWRAIETSAGGAYINTTAVNASAILQADSTTKGFLPPRMTETQRNAIASPAAGLTIYNSTTNQMNIFNGASWGPVGGGLSPSENLFNYYNFI